MTLQEMQEGIRFEVTPEPTEHYDSLVATFTLTAHRKIPSYPRPDEVLAHEKFLLGKTLLDTLFENRRQEIAEVALKLMRSERNLSREGNDLLNQLIALARYSPPAP